MNQLTGVISGLKEIVKRESIFALYKGNTAQMVRIFPYAALQFTSFEIYKNVSNFIYYWQNVILANRMIFVVVALC